ncbi:hypothetical protein [Cognatitamlana onchidii]|uniref:hypothetical protein n=1 Tax=Cognatitamlana onchidii TaxID=2562860 RepID=UPI0010A67EFC|nr:hypothetical protein [Algibacter onchidii]
MKTFLLKSLLFFILVTSITTIILITCGGYVDYFYEKFTTPKSSSFILGDSRSMQGIQPRVIDDYFKQDTYELPMTNYSFTISQIAYGPSYAESIRRKLDLNTKNGLFIITVNPWVLSSRPGFDETKGEFFEENMPPHNMTFVDHNPNFEYLLKNFNYFHFKAIIRRSSKMHKDGWLEESNLPKDDTTLNLWKEKQISIYESFSEQWKKSQFRLDSLKELAMLLDAHGDVVFLRLPIDTKILEIENVYWEQFNKDIIEISKKSEVDYIDFSKSSGVYKTYDGNHLDKYGGVDFTKALCDSIVNKFNK